MNKPMTIQIAAVMDLKGNAIVYALRDDGSLWRKHETLNHQDWQMVDAIPDTPSETPEIPAGLK